MTAATLVGIRAAAVLVTCAVAAFASASAGARKTDAPTGALAFSLGYARDIDYGQRGPRWIRADDLTGTRRTAITPARPKGSRVVDTDLSFSPDGKRIAFFRRGPRPGLYVANADGTRLRRVVAGGAARLRSYGPARWSPDGSKIAFALVGPSSCPLKTSRNASLYVVGSNGRGLHKLRAVTRWGRDWPSYIAVDAWSPDGRTLLYTESQFGGNCHDSGGSMVLTLELQRGRPVELAKSGAWAHTATGVGWSADGTIIAYRECHGDACDVVMRRGNETWVVDPNYDDPDDPDLWGDVRWAPTGHRLASLARFEPPNRNDSGDLQLDLIDFDLRTVKPLGIVRTGYGEAGLGWSSDARNIVVAVNSPVVVYSAAPDKGPPNLIGRLTFSKGVTYEQASLFVG